MPVVLDSNPKLGNFWKLVHAIGFGSEYQLIWKVLEATQPDTRSPNPYSPMQRKVGSPAYCVGWAGARSPGSMYGQRCSTVWQTLRHGLTRPPALVMWGTSELHTHRLYAS